MILFGIVFLLVGIGVGAVVYLATAGRTGTIGVEAFGLSRAATAIELAAYGLATALIFCLGWALIAAGVRRRGRVKRGEREQARIDELERRASADLADSERRFQEAGRRDDDLGRRDHDLGRREREVSVRHDRLDDREQQLSGRERELARRTHEFDEQRKPSVADVVAGRATGSVHDGTAEWVGPAAVPLLSQDTREIDTHPSSGAATEEMQRPRSDGRR